MTQSIEQMAREIAAETWEQSVRLRRNHTGQDVDESWIRATRSMCERGVYDNERDYAAAIAGIKLGREQAAMVARSLYPDDDQFDHNLAGNAIAQAIRDMK